MTDYVTTGCELLSIPYERCNVMDEVENSRVDNDDMLLNMKDRVLVVVEDTDECIPAEQLPAHQDALEFPKKPTEETEEMHNLCKQINGVTDLNSLTLVAHSLVSNELSATEWENLWANENFLDFINSCATHPPAAMHVYALLNSNLVAKKSAPSNIISAFNNPPDGADVGDKLPKQVSTSLEVEELTQGEASSEQIPTQLAETLNTSFDDDVQLKRDTTTANVVPGSHVSSALLPTDTEYVKDSLENTGKHTEKSPLLNETISEPAKSPTSATEKKRHDALSSQVSTLLEVEELTQGEGNSEQVTTQLAETLSTSIDGDVQLQCDVTTANVVSGSSVSAGLLSSDSEPAKNSLENIGKHTEKSPLLNETSSEPPKSPTSATERKKHDALSSEVSMLCYWRLKS